MRVQRALFAGLAGLILAMSAGEARTLRGTSGPKEIPPASYKGKQFVDSRGCLFVRAGFGGTVRWVPRVTRKRQVICGHKPTPVSGARSAADAASAQARAVAAFNGAAPTTVTAPPATGVTTPTRQRTRRAQSNFWDIVKTPKSRTTFSDDPKPTVFTSTPRATPAPTTTLAAVPVTTGGLRIRRGKRTGPQPVHPATFARFAQGAGGVQVTRTTPPISGNYRVIGSDTAATRGVGTTTGQAAMDLIWTQTVPRKLVDTTTGRDVAAQFPEIVYPYTSVAASKSYVPPVAQPRRIASVMKSGTSGASGRAITTTDVSAGDSEPPEVTTVLEQGTEFGDEAVKTYTPPRLRYVQVATFGVPANAVKLVAKFAADGLPTHTRPLLRGGKTYDIVLLGPFSKDGELGTALRKARRLGFGDAFTVK